MSKKQDSDSLFNDKDFGDPSKWTNNPAKESSDDSNNEASDSDSDSDDDPMDMSDSDSDSDSDFDPDPFHAFSDSDMMPSDLFSPFGESSHHHQDSHQNEDSDKLRAKSKKKKDYLEVLHHMVGLDNVYNQLSQFIADAKFRKRVNQLNKGKKSNVPAMSMNLVFEGNPGTGKTMAARLVGKILWQNGFLPNTRFNEIDATDIMNEQVGESGKNLKRWIRKSLGGVLFIDEAYILADKDPKYDGFDSVKAAVLATLVRQIENNRGKLVVILAGYTGPMENLINNTNPGLKSRFSHKILFPDYSLKQLKQIFYYHANREYHFIISNYDKKVVDKQMDKFVPFAKKNKNVGNGRSVRNVLDDIMSAKNLRNSRDMMKLNKKQINTVKASDIRKGFANAEASIHINHSKNDDNDVNNHDNYNSMSERAFKFINHKKCATIIHHGNRENKD